MGRERVGCVRGKVGCEGVGCKRGKGRVGVNMKMRGGVGWRGRVSGVCEEECRV